MNYIYIQEFIDKITETTKEERRTNLRKTFILSGLNDEKATHQLEECEATHQLEESKEKRDELVEKINPDRLIKELKLLGWFEEPLKNDAIKQFVSPDKKHAVHIPIDRRYSDYKRVLRNTLKEVISFITERTQKEVKAALETKKRDEQKEKKQEINVSVIVEKVTEKTQDEVKAILESKDKSPEELKVDIEEKKIEIEELKKELGEENFEKEKKFLEILFPDKTQEEILQTMIKLKHILRCDLRSSNYKEVEAAVARSLADLPTERSTDVYYDIDI